MNFEELQSSRYSCRRFKEETLDLDLVKKALTLAGKAPSSKNTQPWTIDFVQGEALGRLTADMLNAFDEGVKPNPDYVYAPHPLPDLWMARAREVGFALFAHKGIGREDRDKRVAHNRENFEFFKAPGVFFLSLPNNAERGNYLDAGMFLQSLMLALGDVGIASCPSFSAVCFPDLLRKNFAGREDKAFVCGLIVGVEQADHVNDFRSTRAPLEEWVNIWSE